mmetsp:Transcript_3414/g.2391  ORF Transcript_3414/g.2391 Transcript_3414/m.2391 type:complete len:126 (-) Transcript_3414:157-534(-)
MPAAKKLKINQNQEYVIPSKGGHPSTQSETSSHESSAVLNQGSSLSSFHNSFSDRNEESHLPAPEKFNFAAMGEADLSKKKRGRKQKTKAKNDVSANDVTCSNEINYEQAKESSKGKRKVAFEES